MPNAGRLPGNLPGEGPLEGLGNVVAQMQPDRLDHSPAPHRQQGTATAGGRSFERRETGVRRECRASLQSPRRTGSLREMFSESAEAVLISNPISGCGAGTRWNGSPCPGGVAPRIDWRGRGVFPALRVWIPAFWPAAGDCSCRKMPRKQRPREPERAAPDSAPDWPRGLHGAPEWLRLGHPLQQFVQ